VQVLVNYGINDKAHIPALAYFLRRAGLTALSTSKDLTISELLGYAAKSNCSAILLCNENTLRYCVPGDKPTVDKWRGTRLNTSIPIIIINRLAHIHTVNHGAWLLEQDLAKLKAVKIPAQNFRYHLLDDPGRFVYTLTELSQAIAIAYDIETSTGPAISGAKEEDPAEGGKTVITCASWTAIYPGMELRTYTLPLIDFGADHWARDKDYEAALLFLRRANRLEIPKIMHNGMYDCTHSIRYHAEPYQFVYDTMGMAHSEYSELPQSLDFVASYLLYDYIFWKDDSEEAAKKKDIQKYWGYNAKDTWYTARIAIQQLRGAPAYALKNYAEQFQAVYPALYSNFEGLKIDNEKRAVIRKASVEKLEKSRTSIRVKFADPNFNPGSWQQVQKYVYDIFGAKKPNIGKSKSATDEKNLLAVAEQHPLLARITSDILDYREAQKAIGTYYDFLQYQERLLYAINPFGTETSRMACTASSLWCGTQVQNIPPYAKAMLVADDGYELFEADNKQSEGRTTAYCAQDEALIAALEDAERDFYKTLGTLFFNIPYEQVTKEFRNLVLKRIVHGTNYMMGAQTFIENATVLALYKASDTLGIKIVQTPRRGMDSEMTLRQFAKMLLESYHKPFNRIRKWYKELATEVEETGYVVSPYGGHTRKFFGDITRNHNILRGVVAHQPQNLSVRILNVGYRRVYHELVVPGKGNMRLKAQIHDSIFGQIRIGMREYYAPRILECMDNPVVVHGRTLRIPVDIKFGRNWAEGNDKNPNGTFDWKGAH
jgi:DNA polymerase I-like protein with 3'-5' exonuclease and polymerase domains